MGTRTRTTWKPRSDGQYDCRLGWKINRRGNRDQHRFRLGADPKEAKRRDNLLRQMWEKIEQASSSDPTWSDETMELAALVARGVTHLHSPRSSDEDVVAYTRRPFVRVFTALREVEKYLAPMFETGGSSPFQS